MQKIKTMDERQNVITKCLAELHGTNGEPTAKNLEKATDILGSYPKPSVKGKQNQPTPAEIGAYLHVSNARNALKLGVLGYYTAKQAYTAGVENLESASKLIIK